MVTPVRRRCVRPQKARPRTRRNHFLKLSPAHHALVLYQRNSVLVYGKVDGLERLDLYELGVRGVSCKHRSF